MLNFFHILTFHYFSSNFSVTSFCTNTRHYPVYLTSHSHALANAVSIQIHASLSVTTNSQMQRFMCHVILMKLSFIVVMIEGRVSSYGNSSNISQHVDGNI